MGPYSPLILSLRLQNSIENVIFVIPMFVQLLSVGKIKSGVILNLAVVVSWLLAESHGTKTKSRDSRAPVNFATERCHFLRGLSLVIEKI